MKLFKDNQYYKKCWEAFFPSTQIPEEDDVFIKSIVGAGRHLLRRCKIENYSYMLVRATFREEKFKELRIQLHNFQFNTTMLREELYYVGASLKYINQLQHLIDRFSVAIKTLDNTPSIERKLVHFLRVPYMTERQPAKDVEAYLPPEFPIMSSNLFYN